jgi:hypothetical protein
MKTNRIAREENKQKNVNSPKKKPVKQAVDFFFAGGSSDPVSNVVKVLSNVDPSNVDANQNEHSISDNNGGRIELNEDDKLIVKK